MSKSDKHAGKVKPKHKPEKPPAEMMPVKRRKKPEPRYRAEYQWRKHFDGTFDGWWPNGSAHELDQAIHIAKKPHRSFAGMAGDPIRVIDTTTGQVVWQQEGDSK